MQRKKSGENSRIKSSFEQHSKVLVSIHNLMEAALVWSCCSLISFPMFLFTELETGVISIRLGKGKHSTENPL